MVKLVEGVSSGNETVLPISPVGIQLPETKNIAEELANFRADLRKGKRVFHVDDSLAACDGTKDFLSEYFKGRVDFQTDSRKALDIIADRAAKGKIDVLILDMDMPFLSGRELALELAKRGIFIPFVILSGGQGSEETRKFLTQISNASNRNELQATVDEQLKKTNGVAFTYVAKEDAALYPNLLLDAVDAMLLAGERKVSNLDLMIDAMKTETSPIIWGKDTSLHILASMADECLAFVGFHQRSLRELDRLMSGVEPKPEEAGNAQEKVSHMRDSFTDARKYSYDALISISTDREFTSFRHDLLGSEGLATCALMAENLPYCFDGEAQSKISRWARRYTAHVQKFKKRFQKLERDLHDAATFNEVTVDVLVAEVASEYNVPLNLDFMKDPDATLTLDADRKLLEIALTQPIVNAGDAVKGRPGGRAGVMLGKRKISDIPQKAREHFIEKGFDASEEVGYVTISDNGPGISPEILRALENGEEVTSTKTGQPAMGLKLMRETVEKINDGTVVIESSGKGTNVTLYIPLEKKQRT